MISTALASSTVQNPLINHGFLLSVTQSIFRSTPSSLVVASSAYLAITNTLYLARRSYLRNTSLRRVLRILLAREPSVSLGLNPRRMASLRVAGLYVRGATRTVFGRVSFFYAYPKAGGVGVIFEPRGVQHLNPNQRVKHKLRCDWHCFNMNIGNVGRDGFRHPPSIARNLPHIDMPRRGLKHWPWRRRWKKVAAEKNTIAKKRN